MRGPPAHQLVLFGAAALDAGPAGRLQFVHPKANRLIVLGSAEVAYFLRRSARRTIGLSVDGLGLTVSSPRRTSMHQIETLLHKKTRWIVAKLGAAREQQARLQAQAIDWRDGGSLPYLGQPLVMRLDPRAPAGAVQLQEAMAETLATVHLGLPADSAPERLRRVMHNWILGQARRLFVARLDHFAPAVGVRWQRLALTSAQTRWGSASSDGSIRLNWRLLHLDMALIDYVVVHELAHLHEMNHSPRFWAHVERVLPDWAERRRQLRDALTPPW